MARRRRRPSKSTSAKGLGWQHQQARLLLPEPWGQPCPYCSEPMLAGQALDADHVLARALGGAGGPLRWSHARCNRSEGARLGNALKGRSETRWLDRWS